MSKKIVQPKGEGKIIELDAMLEYKNGQVYIKKMNTNEMPAILTFTVMRTVFSFTEPAISTLSR